MKAFLRSRRAFKAGAVALPGLLALVFFLAGEGTRRETLDEKGSRALDSFRELDRNLREPLTRGAKDPGLRWPPAADRTRAFENLQALLSDFPPGTGLELLDENASLVAWAGTTLPEGGEASPHRLELLPAFAGEEKTAICRFGVIVYLGRGVRIPSAHPSLALAAWFPLDLVDPSLRPYFPRPCLAKQLSGELETVVEILPAPPEKGSEESPPPVVLPVPLHVGKGESVPPGVLVLHGAKGPPPRRPGPVTSLLGSLAVLFLAFGLAGPLLGPERRLPVLRFLGFFALCVAARGGLWALNFPGRVIGGAAFDPGLFLFRSFLGSETAGDFLVSAIFAIVATLAFLRLVPQSLHKVVERSRLAAAGTVVLVPFSVPLLSLALARGVAEFVTGSSMAEFTAGSPVDLFPAGRILLPLPGTLLLTGFFLFALCFVLLGTSALHLVYRSLRSSGEGRAVFLTFLSGTAATVFLLWTGEWAYVPILTPAAVLLLLHPIYLKLRREGVTALHTGLFLLAAALAAYPALQEEIRRVKTARVERFTKEAAGRHSELENRLEETVRLASRPWWKGVSRDAPFLPYLLWVKSPLNDPGLSVRLKIKPMDGWGKKEYKSGTPPEWDLNLFTVPGEIEPVEIGGAKGFYIGRAKLPLRLSADIMVFWDWPEERPSFPLPVTPGPGLAFAHYEGGRLVRSTQPGFSAGRPLPDEVADRSGENVWLLEEYPWGSAKVLYMPGPKPGMVVSAALPVPLLSGYLLGFLRLFLSGVLCAAVAFLGHALWKGIRTGAWGFHRRLKNRLIASFALISVLPIFLLGYSMETEAKERIQETVKGRARDELDLIMDLFQKEIRIEDMRGSVEEAPGLTANKLGRVVDSSTLSDKAEALGSELDLYIPEGDDPEPLLRFTSREEVMTNLLIPRRLPPDVYRSLFLGEEAYRFHLETWGGYLVVKGYRRLTDRDFKPIGVLATSRFLPAWTVDAMIAGEMSLILSLYLVSLIIVIFLGLFLARRFAEPLEKLTEATRAVAGGDLDYRIDLTSGDEIGDLVDSFNTMTAQLGESREALVQAEKESAWREMARQIAHEIKNPLTPMKLSAQHIVRAHRDGSEKFEEILEEGIRRITEQIDALGRIAQEFSDFARFPKRDLKSLDLNPLIREAVRLIEEEARGEAFGVEILFREDFEEPLPPVTADEDEIRRVMINLLRNAIQAMAERGGEVAVSTRLVRAAAQGKSEVKKGKTRIFGTRKKLEGEAKHVEIRVADTGPGIPADQQDKLFQPYFSTKSGGTGLGLAICKKAADELGGEIVIESEEGKGTTVILRLPI